MKYAIKYFILWQQLQEQQICELRISLPAIIRVSVASVGGPVASPVGVTMLALPVHCIVSFSWPVRSCGLNW
jgi:hypothetical protein